MTGTAATFNGSSETRTGLLAIVIGAFMWLATWTERNAPEGDDGKHIPANVRRIIKTRNFYI